MGTIAGNYQTYLRFPSQKTPAKVKINMTLIHIN
jgi:hypothetical protein